MKEIRIGNTINITWNLTVKGAVLSELDLMLQRNEPLRQVRNIPFTFEGNALKFGHEGAEQRQCGVYSYTLWANYGKADQAVVDARNAYVLVPRSGGELDTDTEVVMNALIIGVEGPKGDPLTYGDLTPEQIAELQKPARDAVQDIDNKLAKKQDTLKSGENIKTINGETILGKGNIRTVGKSVPQGGEIFNNYDNNNASGLNSHVEGSGNTASGTSAHAEGVNNTANGIGAHVEGYNNQANEEAAHAEGKGNTVAGKYGHAEGMTTACSGSAAHTEGISTETKNDAEHAEGKYNRSNTGTSAAEKTIHSVGIGDLPFRRKNAFEIMQSGAAYFINIGGYDGTNPGNSAPLSDVLKRFIDNTVNNLINYYNKTEVNNLLGQMTSVNFEIVTSLPGTGQPNIIYLIRNTSSAESDNLYDEYIWNVSDTKYEKIGSTQADFTNYYQKTEADERFALKADVDKLIDDIDAILDNINGDTEIIIDKINGEII